GDASAATEQQPAPAENTGAPASVFIVPDNLNITLNAKAGEIVYDKLVLNDVKGTVAIRNETVYLQNLSGRGLDGSMQIDGSYSTKNDKRNPEIHLTYKLQ